MRRLSVGKSAAKCGSICLTICLGQHRSRRNRADLAVAVRAAERGPRLLVGQGADDRKDRSAAWRGDWCRRCLDAGATAQRRLRSPPMHWCDLGRPSPSPWGDPWGNPGIGPRAERLGRGSGGGARVASLRPKPSASGGPTRSRQPARLPSCRALPHPLQRGFLPASRSQGTTRASWIRLCRAADR